jgi:hypothetical protein
LLADLTKPWVLQSLGGRDSVISVVNEKFLDQIDYLGASLGNKFGDAGPFYASHAELSEVHVRCVPLKLVQQLLVRSAEDVMNFVDLVEFIVTGEQGEQRDDFEHDATDTPQVHLVPVVTVC